MATQTIFETVTHTINVTHPATSSSANRAAPQGGILEGLNPTVYQPSNPIILFIIQAAIVIILTRLLHYPLSKLRQPRVIAEVITGILLGPSVMGRIPGFTNAIFPTASMPAFLLAANLGLVLFLFQVGLEVDLRFLASNWRIAMSVGLAGMALPFGLGCAIAVGLYHEFRHDSGLAPIAFGTYMLFIGVAMAITAFPVLCRILVSLKLLDTPVGVIVLAAGVGNDVVGWILLALCVALVNSGAGVDALYILLIAVGYALFLAFLVRPTFVWMLRRTGSLANGPTQGVVAITILMVLASAFFTGIIGIHPIFGAFMMGLMMPHDGGFAVKLTEKIEDLVGVLFLPLYFTSSGLSTNLGLLNNGITWGYVVGVCACAWFGKIAGGTLAAKLNGLVWRESLTIGCLMSCKGLVELIVLNIGLQAKILSTRTFSIFVLMAILTTIATTPLTMWLYPPWYQHKLDLWKKGKIQWDGTPMVQDEDQDNADVGTLHKQDVAKSILVYLRLDGLPALISMVSLFGDRDDYKNRITPATPGKDGVLQTLTTLRRPVQIHGLRLLQLTERESSVMRVSELEDFATRDPVIKSFGTFGQSHNISIAGQIAVVPEHSFSTTLTSRAAELQSDFMLMPWSETGTLSEQPSIYDTPPENPLQNRAFASLVQDSFESCRSVCSIGVFLDKTTIFQSSTSTSSPILERSRTLSRMNTGVSLHEAPIQYGSVVQPKTSILTLYQGDHDDLFAVRLALQLAKNSSVRGTILVAEPAKGSTPESSTETGFTALRTTLPESLRDRVSYIDIEDHGIDAIVDAVEGQTSETVVILPRNARSDTNEMPSSSNSFETRAVGHFATTFLRAVKERELNVSLMVVQSRINQATHESGGVLARKASRATIEQ